MVARRRSFLEKLPQHVKNTIAANTDDESIQFYFAKNQHRHYRSYLAGNPHATNAVLQFLIPSVEPKFYQTIKNHKNLDDKLKDYLLRISNKETVPPSIWPDILATLKPLGIHVCIDLVNHPQTSKEEINEIATHIFSSWKDEHQSAYSYPYAYSPQLIEAMCSNPQLTYTDIVDWIRNSVDFTRSENLQKDFRTHAVKNYDVALRSLRALQYSYVSFSRVVAPFFIEKSNNKAIQHDKDEFCRQVSRHPSLSPTLLLELVKHPLMHESCLIGIAQNRATPTEALQVLSTHAKAVIRSEAARHTNIDVKTLKTLGTDTSILVYQGVGYNKKTDAEILHGLTLRTVADKQSSYTRTLARHPRISTSSLYILLQYAQSRYDVWGFLQTVVDNPQTSSDVLYAISQGNYGRLPYTVNCSITKHPNIDERLILFYANAPVPHQRSDVLQHAITPMYLKQSTCFDEYVYVRQKARSLLSDDDMLSKFSQHLEYGQPCDGRLLQQALALALGQTSLLPVTREDAQAWIARRVAAHPQIEAPALELLSIHDDFRVRRMVAMHKHKRPRQRALASGY